MTVDDIVCTGVTPEVTTQTAPDGKTWTLDLSGSCGALGNVSVFVASKDDIAYPQSCGSSTHVQMGVGAEGDAGWFTYSTDGGSCEVKTGPTTSDQSAPVSLTATVVAGDGRTHQLRYQAAPPPPPPPPSGMIVDGITCTGVTTDITPQSAPDGKTWMFNLSGTCGVVGLVEVYAHSKDDFPYPQACQPYTVIQMSAGGEGDAGWLAYSANGSNGSSCTVFAGPSTANQTTPVVLSGVVTNGSGKSHTLSYAP